MVRQNLNIATMIMENIETIILIFVLCFGIIDILIEKFRCKSLVKDIKEYLSQIVSFLDKKVHG